MPFKRYVLEKKPATIANALEVATSFEQLNERCPPTSSTPVNYIQQYAVNPDRTIQHLPKYHQNPNPLVPLHQYTTNWHQPQQQNVQYNDKFLAIERQLQINQAQMNERMLTMQNQLLTMQQQINKANKQPSSHNQWRKQQYPPQQPQQRYVQRRKPIGTHPPSSTPKSSRPSSSDGQVQNANFVK